MILQETSVKTLHIIINPVSGKKNDETEALILEGTKAAGIDSEMFLTEKAGDASRFAKAAIEKGVDAVAVCGGDGTVLEVASALMGSDVPLFIIPGGSANVLATELGIPKDIKEACALLKGELEIKFIDAGRFNDGYFLCRAALGLEADIVKGADRETKNKVGCLAYFVSAFAAVKKMRRAVYHITIDGKEYKTKGLTCIVTNAGNVGFSKVSMDKNIDISDGLLDVLVARKANWSMMKHVLATLVKGERPYNWDLVTHWQGKEISVISRPKQRIECDGEISNSPSFKASILPGAVKLLVPKVQGELSKS